PRSRSPAASRGRPRQCPSRCTTRWRTTPTPRSRSAWCCWWSPSPCWRRCASAGSGAGWRRERAQGHSVSGRRTAPPPATGADEALAADLGLRVDATVRRGGFSLTLDLTVPPGQVLGVLGPNGSGKTTLLRALAGLAPVADGRITLGGKVLDDAA